MLRPRLCFAALCLAMSSIVLPAEEARRASSNGLPPYRVDKETKVSGVLKAIAITGAPDGPPFTRLNLTIDGKPLHVLLAPEAWMKTQRFPLQVGSVIDATGVSDGMRYEGEPAMMARQIKAGGKTLDVRDAKGVPAWEK